MSRETQAVMGGLILVTSAFFCFPMVAGATNDDTLIEASRGTVSFEVGTNVPALRVHGKSNTLTARARLGSGPEGVMLEQIEASVAVRSLETGLGLRDEHMRKYIFTTTDGQIPDLRFSGERAECAKSGPEQRTTCVVNGTLAIRNTARPFTMTLTISEEKGNLRASGDGIVKLSTYGIDQPSQLGVRTADEVKLKLEITARRPATQVVDSRAAR
jgi:polyisoprenoid-binding protein YceI